MASIPNYWTRGTSQLQPAMARDAPYPHWVGKTLFFLCLTHMTLYLVRLHTIPSLR